MRRQLSIAEGTRIEQVSRLDTDLPPALDAVRGVVVVRTRRLGKRIAVDLRGGSSLVLHPRITGALERHPWRSDRLDIRATLDFDGVRFAFTDRRRLGSLDVIATDAFERGYGVDLLNASEGSLQAAAVASSQRRRAVKPLMLDQSGPVCGAGNYLIDETLFALRVHPLTDSRDLSTDRWEQIWTHCRGLAQRSLANRPALLADYIASADAVGEQKDSLVCYGRAGLPCVLCGSLLVRLRVANRGTTVCPRCQVKRTSLASHR